MDVIRKRGNEVHCNDFSYSTILVFHNIPVILYGKNDSALRVTSTISCVIASNQQTKFHVTTHDGGSALFDANFTSSYQRPALAY